MCIICEGTYHNYDIIVINCNEVKEIPYLPKTQILKVYSCDNLSVIHNQKYLTELTIDNCKKINILPKSNVLKCLNIYKCGIINISDIHTLTRLSIDSTGIMLISNLIKLEFLSLTNEYNIYELGNLHNILHLELIYTDIKKLKYYPKLISLHIHNNNVISYIPKIDTLSCLSITDCPNMNTDMLVKCDIKNNCIFVTQSFESLINLNVSNNVFENIPSMYRLEVLDCSNTNITHIHQYNNLRKLICDGCMFINELPIIPTLISLSCKKTNIKVIQSYPSLKYLNCHESKVVIIESMPNLNNVTADECENLITIGNNSPINVLSINNCNNLVIDLIYFPIVELECRYCMQIIHISNIPSLKMLDCSGCYNLISVTKLPMLMNFNCKDCNVLEKIDYFDELITINSTNTKLKNIKLPVVNSAIIDKNTKVSFINNKMIAKVAPNYNIYHDDSYVNYFKK